MRLTRINRSEMRPPTLHPLILRAAVCLIGSLPIAAQDGPFRVQTKVVQVPVSVTEKNGRNVEGLAARNFRVLDNGVPQEVTLDDFSSDSAPISLAIVIQTSGISKPALAKVRRIGGMIQPLVIGLRGAAAIVTFNSRIQWLQDFTSDDTKIRDAVKNLTAGPGLDQQSRMLDAIAQVANRMQERKGRNLLLLISENRDRGSRIQFEQAMEAVEREGIEIFGAHYSTYASALIAKPKDLPDLSALPELPDDPLAEPAPPPTINFLAIFSEFARLGKTNAVQALTRATGGSDYPFLKERGIENAIEKLGVEVHSQYLLSFPQRESTAGIHQIEVSVPNRADLQIRSRRTYWAEPATSVP